ncbi:MAG: alpha/beta hydrolase [Rhizobiaceae bacterium]|nr:alpha/beta hydrolase [Rhizobiaceae bacterium]
MTPEQIITVVGWLLSADPVSEAFPVIASGGADPRYPVIVEACPANAVPPTDVEGKTVVCGRVSVPENHDKPDGNRIELAFAVLKAHTLSPVPDPVIYLHGGPGGGTVRELASIVHPLFDGYRSRRDVVTFDQRAAGISSDVVTCFNTLGGNIFELFVPTEFTDEKQAGFMQSCVKEVTDSGRDITAYNTRQNALDVRALMQAIGYQDYNIYGVSYGTTLGLEVMRSAPEGLRSVILDSVSPPQAKVYVENSKPTQEAIQAVVDQCAADEACNKSYPELGPLVLRVADRLQKEPIPASRGKPEVTVMTLIELFAKRNEAGALPNATRYIPLILTEWERGESTTWDLLSSGATNATPSTEQRLAPFADKLTADQKAVARLLLEGASNEAREDSAQYVGVQAFTQSLKERSAGGADFADRFSDMLERAIIATHSKDEMLGFLRSVAALVPLPPSKQALRDLVNAHVPALDQPSILAVLEVMSDADVAAFFAEISGQARTAFAGMVGAMDLFIVACQESVPFNSREGFDAFNASLTYPFLGLDVDDQIQMFEICKLFIPLPESGHHAAVTSPIPALVLYGLNDTQTSSADAKDTAQKLGNARALGFPEAGHGSLIFSQCAKDIGLAFIEQPGANLATGCIESLKPKWVLPPSK